jgi:hypothetical protein
MNAHRLDDFKKHLEKLKRSGPLSICGHLESFPAIKPTKNLNVNFYLQKCDADRVLEKEFREFLSEQIIRYVIKHKFLDPKKMKDSAYQTRLYRRARKRFSSKSPNAAEVGELILFVLLESEGILQIVQKMPLKTNKEMPVHGSDGIHVQVADGYFLLYFGESKMVKSYQEGIRKALLSISNFYKERGGESERDLDVEIISTHIDEIKFEGFTDLIEELVLPYEGDKSKRREVKSIFVGYNWDALKTSSNGNGKDLTTHLSELYSEVQPSIVQYCSDAIARSDYKNEHFHIQFIPFIDEEKFREKFKEDL